MGVLRILGATAILVAPGALLSILLWPAGAISLPGRVALVVPLGFAAVALVSFGLALLGLLSLTALVLTHVAGTAALAALVVARGRFGEHRRAWRVEIATDRWALGLGLAVVLAFAMVRLSYSPALNLADQTPLRYWADGLEVADSGRIPAESLQWGRLVPSAQSKVLLNAFDGSASLVLGRGPLGPLGALLFVMSAGLLLAGFGLAWELGLRLTAPLATLLLFGNDLIGPRDLTTDLLNFKAENWGRVVMLASVLLFVRAVRAEGARVGRTGAVTAGVLLGVCAGTHLVAAAMGVAFILAYVAAWALLRSPGGVALSSGAMTLAPALIVGGLVLALPPGEVGFEGAGDRRAYEGVVDRLGLPEGFDLTRYLALGQLDQPPRGGAFYDPPSHTYHEYVRRAVGQPLLRRPMVWAFPVALLLAMGVVLALGHAPLRVLAVTSVLTAAAILAIGLAFNARYDVYVLAEFGPRRLFDYTGLFVVLIGASLGEVALARLSSRTGSPRWGSLRLATPVVAAVLTVGIGIAAVPRVLQMGERAPFFATALGPLEWIEQNAPCDGRILADRRTLATFQTLTRRAGVLEGMGPYLRPELLGAAVQAMLDARRFFAAPLDGERYLREQAVAAVAVTSYDQTLGGVGGPLRVGPVARAALERADFLRPVARSSTVTVYEVMGFVPPPGAFPDVTGRAGYRCPAGSKSRP
ncbi:hypothetical protein BH20ACT24_BH20ACT24_01740 [soil metagenome]